MPFPRLQKMPLAFSTGSTFTLNRVFDDEGFSTEQFDDFHKELPPAENYDLANMIRNKIPLQEVNPKILGGNTLKINVAQPSDSTELTEPTKTTSTNKGE